MRNRKHVLYRNEVSSKLGELDSMRAGEPIVLTGVRTNEANDILLEFTIPPVGLKKEKRGLGMSRHTMGKYFSTER